MVVNNTVKKNEGCPCDNVRITSVQAFVTDERGEISYSKYSPVHVEHGESDIVIKAGTHNIIRDKSGKIIDRKPVSKSTMRKDDGLTH